MLKLIAGFGLALFAAGHGLTAIRVTPDAGSAPSTPLPMRWGGRVVPPGSASPDTLRQWPGTYFETAFRGTAALFRVGTGDVILHILVDERKVATLVKPKPGSYRIAGLASGAHRLRIEVASESQARPTGFGGFQAPSGTRAAGLPVRTRRIEFVGDSHTVGYANTSTKQTCTEDEVWASTDTSQSFGPLVAKHYGADYRVNAISGRGMVRNYNGFAADPLPQAYPYRLFDRKGSVDMPGWPPQVIVVALGTNDFSTPLHSGEPWETRDALHADYETTYVSFIRNLRARHPRAFFILWATDKANGEVKREVGQVVDRLRASGEKRVAFVPIAGLTFGACNSHPSLDDERKIALALRTAIDGQVDVWRP
jgi:lysophospholipase L1-like esterase